MTNEITVYSYNPTTCEFSGETIARRDPLEIKETFLIPAFATEIKPTFIDGKITKWSGSNWILEDLPLPPEPIPPTLQEAKAAKMIQLKKDKDAALYAHIEYLDTFFISSEKANQNILGALTLNGDNNLWLDSNGHKVILSKMQLKELGILIKNQRTACYVKEASYTSQINACKTLEEVNAINIEF